jgi:DtxR family Mn-dependent transcriptional regulator
MISRTEENYLKSIFKIAERNINPVNTNAISKVMNTSAASVTDMIKRLNSKNLINYEKYKGVSLTDEGARLATQLIRKHRLWEVFLVEKLNFDWSEVHELAEELEHIQSEELVNRIEKFLGNPKFDPHGDPIPNAEGKFTIRNQSPLSNLVAGEEGILVGLRNSETSLLKYLDSINTNLGTHIKIFAKIDYDNSIKVIIDHKHEVSISSKVSSNLFVKKT